MVDGDKSVKFGVMVDETLLRRFRIVALQEGKPATQVVREFIAWYVGQKEAA